MNWTLLSRWEKNYSETDAGLPNVFAVISWGCTATKWAATALNSVPGIFSVHCGVGILRSLAQTKEPDDVTYLRTLRVLAAGHRLAGDVHGIPRQSVPALREFFGAAFKPAVLIRDPVRRLQSQIKLFEQNGYNDAAWPGLDYLLTRPGYDRIAHLIDEPRKKFFVHGVNCLNAIVEEVDVGPVFRSEDLTTDPTSFSTFVEYLSGDSIKLDEDEAEKILQLEPINSHQRGARPAFEEPWQIEVLRAIVLKQAWDLYEQFGYTIPNLWREADGTPDQSSFAADVKEVGVSMPSA